MQGKNKLNLLILFKELESSTEVVLHDLIFS